MAKSTKKSKKSKKVRKSTATKKSRKGAGAGAKKEKREKLGVIGFVRDLIRKDNGIETAQVRVELEKKFGVNGTSTLDAEKNPTGVAVLVARARKQLVDNGEVKKTNLPPAQKKNGKSGKKEQSPKKAKGAKKAKKAKKARKAKKAKRK